MGADAPQWSQVDVGWGRKAADAATLHEPQNVREYVAMHQRLGVGPGSHVLDIACGAGLAVELAAASGASVAGIDAAERLVAVARDRCPAADVRVGDMRTLPWADATFDVVTSFRGIWGTTPEVLHEVRRVLRPGGVLGLTVWGHVKASPGAWALRPFLWAHTSKVAHQTAMNSLGKPGVGEALLASYGFEQIQRVRVPFAWEFADPDSFARALACTGPGYEAIEEVGEERFLRDAARLAQERQRDGLPLRADIDVTGFVARVPAPAAPGPSFLAEPTQPSEQARLMYEEDRADLGYVMNASRTWAHDPEAMAGVFRVLGHVTKTAGLTMRDRGILVTATASTVADSYCSLMWGRRLAAAASEQLSAGVLTGDDSLLDDRERALAGWARRVARDSNAVVAGDVQQLRDAGYDDAQILAITAYVALRIAFSTVNDALGAVPDWQVRTNTPQQVLDAVTYGRPPAEPPNLGHLMATVVRLLGPPSITRDGVPTDGPRGRKAWGLLAFLILAEYPPSRQRLGSLLFERADDPRAALRWNLAEMRRALGATVTVEGDPVKLVLAADVSADLAGLVPGGEVAAAGPPHGELLEGLTFEDSPAFETWLSVERRRLGADCRALAYRLSVELLTGGDPAGAASTAARAVENDLFNTDLHAVLVASLVAAGDPAGARAHVARCADLYRRDLGMELPAAVACAADPPAGAPATEAVVRSLLDLADASLSAGAVANGVDQLRRAVAGVGAGDHRLSARAHLALASALIHAQGGRGGDVITLLHRARVHAGRAGDATSGAAACRELAFLAIQRGNRAEVEHWLMQAEQWHPSLGESARILGVRGMSLSDAGGYDRAYAALTASIDTARRAGDRRQVAWSQAMVGRIHLLRGEAHQAVPVLDASLEGVQAERWTAFAPFPQALRAEVAVALDDPSTACEILDYAWVLATEAGDQCWIAAVTHARAVLARADGRDALAWCRTGLAAAPWYLWMRARLLDLAAHLTPGRVENARLVEELEQVAGAGAMRELTVRALIHRSRTGGPAQILRARAMAADIANPTLNRLIDAGSAGE